MTHDTQKYHKSGNIDDLSYDVTTPEGYCCKFSPTPQGLHVFKIKDRSGSSIFDSKAGNNNAIFGGAYHVLVESQDEPDSNITGVNDDTVEVSEGDSANLTGVSNNNNAVEVSEGDSANLAGVSNGKSGDSVEMNEGGRNSDNAVSNQKKVRFQKTIVTVAGSRSKFSKRD